MGYSTRKSVLDGRRDTLRLLEEGRACRWRPIPPDNAENLAFRIHEALYIARLYPNDYPTLAEVAARTTISIQKDGTVTATVAENSPEAVRVEPVEGIATVAPHGVASHGIAPAGGPTRIPGPQTAYSIIEAWRAAQAAPHANQKLTFIDAGLTPDDLDRLARWASQQTPKWHIVEHEGTVVVHPHDVEVARVAYRARVAEEARRAAAEQEDTL